MEPPGRRGARGRKLVCWSSSPSKAKGSSTRLRSSRAASTCSAWPTTEKQRYADEHNGGWGEYLDRLARLLAERT